MGKTANYDMLKLQNQICFPLYVCSKEIVRKYKPYLEEIGLTYTQYITMMVMWEHERLSVKDIGECLYLDSGTLTPVLKTLAKNSLIIKERDMEDERVVMITLSDKGRALREKASKIPGKIASCVNLDPDDAKNLYIILHKMLKSM